MFVIVWKSIEYGKVFLLKCKEISGGGGARVWRSWGANSLFRKKENFKNEKIKNLGIFPDV